MNAFFRQINGALLCVMMITPVYGMEHEGAELQNSQVWYKKRSMQVRIGAAVTGMAALYAAVRIGIIAVPAVLAGVFVKVAQNSSPINAQDNNDAGNKDNNISEEEHKDNPQQCNENQIDVGNQFAEVDADHDVNNIVEVVVKQEIKERATLLYNEIKDFGTNVMDSVKQLKSNMMNSVKRLRSEDLQQTHF